MRHGNKGRKLGRTATHRKATLNALATSLIQHKKIKTTVAKAKETRMYVEPLITTAKRSLALSGDEKLVSAQRVHARRQIGRYIKDGEVLKTLFTEIAPKVAARPGGYTRVVKLGRRLGDSAEMAILELVDWNESGTTTPKTKVSKPRPTRRKTQPAKPAAETAEAPGAANEDVADVPSQE
ncbi:MAG: 50S ribosomal protein L17 [Bacteroidota bacterium]|nr:50S ribosomal protein L17 [Bacteroidota bacterium]MDP4231086.1 50S ribosomal protein L17 [Bacteroidota bacterium]MDP4236726.1 50S ribosomal protein L17 [Bacteroidota bacterium]